MTYIPFSMYRSITDSSWSKIRF